MNKLTFLESKITNVVRETIEGTKPRKEKKSHRGIRVDSILIAAGSSRIIVNPGQNNEQCRKFEAFPTASKWLQEYKRLSLMQLTSKN